MPDRAEIAKLIEQAEKLLQKGKTPDALDRYLLVLAEDPENDNVRQMAADLCLSLNRPQDSARLLGELFERQVNAGDATRASLTYKKLARHGNPTWEQKVRFGQLLEQSNKRLAIGTYENALEELSRSGRKAESLEVIKRVVALEPTQQNFLRLGELCAELGDAKSAAEAFLQVAELAQAAGSDGAQWLERAYSEDPSELRTALAYGKSLLDKGEVGAAIFIFEPHVQAGEASLDLRDLYARALVAANRLGEAEPFVWALFEQNPTRIHQVIALVGAMIDAESDAEAVALARKLEAFQRRRGERRAFVTMMQDVIAAHRTSPELLEFLSELFNASNRENDYCQTLLKLFDLYCSTGNFDKAGECLDRAAEVDPYEHGHQKRLEMLRGKIDENRFQVIASRFTTLNKSAQEPMRTEEVSLGTAALQDLMLQAEILVQYGMRSKAIERLQRIQELFPHEEEKNEDLQRLYLSAGMTPTYSGTAPAAAPAARAAVTATTPPPPPHPAGEAADVSSLTKVAEITRKLNHQSNPNSVLSTAVKEIGAQWKTSRCVAAMRRPGLPPTTVQEYQAEGLAPGEAAALVQVVSALHDLAVKRGAMTIADAMAMPELQGVRQAFADLSATSVLALPLDDGEESVGIVVLIQAKTRGWHATDIVVLKALAEQVVIALNNAGLRRLVKNLSVTDEKSGLLKRASYIDLLLAETRRAVQQGTSMSILLLQFGKRNAMLKEFGEEAVEAMMERIGQLFSTNIRTNDLAFRYELTTIAIILGDTAEKEGLLAVEKLRKLLSEVRLPGKDQAIPLCAGLAEAVMRQQYDPVDIVTEVINRAEQALHEALAQGSGKVVALASNLATAAVA
ncbi:MAG TPA: diguanylate cyclase [Terriglobales bacterium]|nr:diguanylate cyclase [Terriglobales bacterium]